MKREDLDDLAGRIGDDKEVDWGRVERVVDSAEDRAVLEQLRILQSIARVHRSGEPVEAPVDAEQRTWGHLQLRRMIGEGAHGRVYLAWDPRLEREVALKLLYARDLGARGASEVIHEARLLARVKHPNVITIYGAERRDGEVGLWMEYIEGNTLGSIIEKTGQLGPGETALLGLTLCRALGALHRENLLHRDIKAQNVMRARGGRIVLMDFGTAHERVADAAGLAGSPLYLAPEIFAGQPATARSDIYSLGVLLYYAVSGEYPVNGRSFDELRDAHRTGRRRLLRDAQPDLPDSLAPPIDRALAPDPADRIGSTGELAEALTQALGVRTERRPSGPSTGSRSILAGVMLVILALAAAAWLLGMRRTPDFSTRRLTFALGQVTGARFAPDARTVIYSARWTGRPEALFSTSFGSIESRPMGDADASVLAISARGEVALRLRSRFLRGYLQSGTLAQVPLGGGTARELLHDVQEADWAPDGTSLAIVRDSNGISRLEFPIDNVIYESGGWISDIRVSPDGRHIAFVDHPVLADDSGTVMVVDLTGDRKALSAGWASVKGLAWAPTGAEIWFTAADSGNARALHAVNLAGRRRVVLRTVSKLHLQDISREGEVLVTEEHTRVGIMARRPGDDAERDLSWLDWSLARDLSDDGELLLFNESGEGGGARYGVYLRRTDGSPAVKLGDGSGISISPDNAQVLAYRLDGGLMLLPVGPGEPRQLPGSLRYQQWGTWFPDGRRVLFAARDERGASRVYVQEVDGGQPRPVTEEGVFLASSDALSPNGRFIAGQGRDQFPTLFPVEGGAARRVPGTVAGEIPVHWTADGRGVYVTPRGLIPAPVDIVDVMTGARKPWRTLMPPDPTGVHEILRIILTSDGATYAYSFTRELSTLHALTGLK